MTTHIFLSQPVLTRLQTIYEHFQGRSIVTGSLSPYASSIKDFLETSDDELELAPGEILFKQDDPGDSMYWIESGSLAILQGDLKNPHLLTFRHPGQVVGEIALIEDIPRSATALAVIPTKVKFLDKQKFQGLLAQVPAIGLEIMRLLSSRLREVKPAEFSSGYYDHLTGALSRQALDGRLQEEILRAQRYNFGFSLIFIDLDRFKEINDTYGHARGDEVLIEFVQRIMADLRATDLFFRYGGDEFVLLLQGVDQARGHTLVLRLLDDLSRKPVPGDPPLEISFSAGFSTFPADGDTPELLLKAADRHLYQVKNSGRGLANGKMGV